MRCGLVDGCAGPDECGHDKTDRSTLELTHDIQYTDIHIKKERGPADPLLERDRETETEKWYPPVVVAAFLHRP